MDHYWDGYRGMIGPVRKRKKRNARTNKMEWT